MTRDLARGRAARRWLAAAVVSVLALTTSSVAPVFASREGHLHSRQSSVNSGLRSAQRDLDESSTRLLAATQALHRTQDRLDDARARLADTRVQLAAARQRDQQAQAELNDAEARLAAAEIALADGQAAVERAEQELATLVVNSYQYGDPALASLSTVLDGGSDSDLGEQLSLLDSVAGAQSATIDQLTAAKTLLSIQEQQVADVRDEVAVRRAAAAENLDAKQQLELSAQQQAASVRALVADRRAAEARAKRAAEADRRRIRSLRQERAHIETMLTRLAERNAGPSLTVADTGRFLSPPVYNAYVTSPYGMRLHPILHIWELHDGTDFAAACGTPVHAAAAGTVVSVGPVTGYGNRVIVNHGQVNGVSLATSYNHLSRFVAHVGDHVRRGQLVAYSGNTGYSTGCHLHFTVYVDGATVNPMGWL